MWSVGPDDGDMRRLCLLVRRHLHDHLLGRHELRRRLQLHGGELCRLDLRERSLHSRAAIVLLDGRGIRLGQRPQSSRAEQRRHRLVLVGRAVVARRLGDRRPFGPGLQLGRWRDAPHRGDQLESAPPGAVIHTFGSGTSFNPFTREFPAQTFATPGAAIAFLPFNYGYVLGAFGPAFEDVSSGGTATTLTPITTLGSPLATAVDVAYVGGSFAQRLLAAFDNSGKLSVYVNYLPGSAPPYWATVVQLQPPSGTVFNFSPSICGDAGLTATQRIHLVAVADGELWDTYSDSSYSTWERIGTQAASAPDCALMGDQTVHVVTLNNAGHVLDIYGSPGSWTTTDLGTF